MHCWRHKTPIIYRATTQWFAGMDDVPGYHGDEARASTLRETALAGIDATQLLSRRGARRGSTAMIANRPDWTLSRQRQWGVPMPFFVAQGDRRAASATRRRCSSSPREGGEGRHRGVVRRDARGLRRRPGEIPARSRTRSTCGSTRARRTRRCWAARRRRTTRAGSHAAGHRLSRRPLPRRLRPASRLVPLVAARLVHAERRAAVQGAADARLRRRRRRPEDVEVEGQRRRAAEGVRHARRRDPAPVGRRDRLLGRALDLRRDPEARRRELPPHPQHAALPAREHRATSIRRATPSRSPSWSRSTATRSRNARALLDACRADYDRYEFHLVGAAAADLSAPRTSAASISTCSRTASTRRRKDEPRPPFGADGALRRSATRCCELMAPILSFTAEEAWRIVHPDDRRSSATRGATRCRRCRTRTALLAKWPRILAVRAAVLKELEALRQRRADRLVAAGGGRRSRRPTRTSTRWRALGDDLRFVLITSAARVERAEDDGALAIAVNPSGGDKCERCWHWRADVGADSAPSDTVRALRRQPLRQRRTRALPERRDALASTWPALALGERAPSSSPTTRPRPR